MNHNNRVSAVQAVRRTQVWYAVLLLIVGVFVVRLFYLQVVRYDYYHHAALSDQLKQYSVPARRGLIEVRADDGSLIPLVLNQTLYTIYADPTLVHNPDKAAKTIAATIGGTASDYAKKIRPPSRYAVLARKVSAEQKDKLLSFKLPGIGAQAQDYRTYPQGNLAAQVLGFVNNDGQGEYGLEQARDKELAGTPGELKAVTDVNGVPLVAGGSNVQKAPVAGNNLVLSVSLAMQHELEQILARDVTADKALGGSALIMDPNTGAIKAMANFPTYNPAEFFNVSDARVFTNAAISQPIEVGSSMKVLTTAAALDLGVIKPNTTYYDPAQWTVDGFKITNIEEDGGPGTKTLDDVLNLSLNTGATWMLMQMGGGQINQKARQSWHDYMSDHYQFGKPTGIEQGYEAAGTVPDPNHGYALDLTYANTAFGQAMTATPLQMGAALSSVINGGTYYHPHLIDQTIAASGKSTPTTPKIIRDHVVSPAVGQTLVPLMQYVVQQHLAAGFSYLRFDSNYVVGGKTGTAQIAKPGGGYYENEYNGTYAGFVGGDKPQYVIVVFVNQPKVPGYAGSYAAQPLFADLAHMLINDSYVTPKSH